MATITLLTDFGLTDTYVGQMKGVIADIAPHAKVIDLTHGVPPQQVLAGAVMLDAAVDAFADEAIHVAVVDPGVGSQRQPIAVQTERGIFVGPDNGLFTAALARCRTLDAVSLTNHQYQRDHVSATFHGRDVFAPAAAHLAAGVALAALGEAIDPVTLVRLDLPQPIRRDDGLTLHVLWVDHFGNLVTDLHGEQFAAAQLDAGAAVKVGDTLIRGIATTFSDVPPGQPVAYFGSTGRLEIAIRNGSAAARFAAEPGTMIDLLPPAG